MPDRSFLGWPFFDDRHRALAERLRVFGRTTIEPKAHDHGDPDALTKMFARALAAAGFLDIAVPGEKHDVRSLCLAREHLAYHSGLADFAFAMQGLGTGPIVLFGSDAQKTAYLPQVRTGESLAAFALSEPEGGSDASALRMTATRSGNGFVLTGDAPGAKGLSAFVVAADQPGLTIEARIETIAPHPLATLRFDNARVTADALLGNAGDGFKIAMSTLDIFRSTVAAAALGFARRALDEAISYSKQREAFGSKLVDFQLTQAALADMATEIDAAALLVYRAAWTKDVQGVRVTREASMAKFYATEMAQRAADRAVQLHGGQGVVSGNVAERLYREVRALRIYEGTSEIQKLVIAGQTLAAFDKESAP
jgi:acyl-CoA dehydrogenase